MYRKHRNKVITSHVCWSPITMSSIIATLPIWLITSTIDEEYNPFLLYGCHHYPPIYGNKYLQKEKGRPEIRSDYNGQ